MYQFLTLILFVAVCIITETNCDEEDNLVFKYDGMELQKSMDDYFTIAFHEINNKVGSDSIVTLNGTIDQKIDLDDDWKSDITVFRSDTVDGEYIEYMKLPKVGICFCMKTIYKKYFYPNLKDCSNFPPPDTCPLTKQKYWINCEFDAKVFQHASKPGFYKINANLLKGDEIKTGIELRGSVSVK